MKKTKVKITVLALYFLLVIGTIIGLYFLTKNNFNAAEILMRKADSQEEYTSAKRIEFYANLAIFYATSFLMIIGQWLRILLLHTKEKSKKNIVKLLVFSFLQTIVCFFAFFLNNTPFIINYSLTWFAAEIILALIISCILINTPQKSKQQKQSLT